MFSECFKVAKLTERYEDCAEIKRVAAKHNIGLETSLEDWQTEFRRLGVTGETAMENAPAYLAQALQEIGYIDGNSGYMAADSRLSLAVRF